MSNTLITAMAEEEEEDEAKLLLISSSASASSNRFTARCTGSKSIIVDFTAILQREGKIVSASQN
jgi:hypothetical protein